MHELLLYGQVSAARHDQVLKILAGVAAMQPRRILQRRILYRPEREPEEPGSHLRRGGTQAVAVKQKQQATTPTQLYYTQLVQKLSDEDFGKGDSEASDTLSADVDFEGGEEPKWSTLFEDIPDTGDRGVSIRFTNSTDLIGGDPHTFMATSGPNCFVTEYYIEGHRFVHRNVVIFLHRVLHEPGVRNLQTEPKVKPPAFEALQLLDQSGTYILEAKVRVQDFKDASVLESGVGELKAFQTSMKGCVELSLPDRLTMDTRVKYKPPPGVVTTAQVQQAKAQAQGLA
ncbi:mediator complex, subunit Med18 [Boeremia exigua]|uniref:mediator complex, subunit Med18 n=1 Tax=Boeremia exigua TaxID=749465 RepID=UPI001E8DA13A|nr:mediator complex, subunit Med18 [Boeremia exigua]KAH6639530.1 mediator complex, subunit Med18 [Boeremia exigua]